MSERLHVCGLMMVHAALGCKATIEYTLLLGILFMVKTTSGLDWTRGPSSSGTSALTASCNVHVHTTIVASSSSINLHICVSPSSNEYLPWVAAVMFSAIDGVQSEDTKSAWAHMQQLLFEGLAQFQQMFSGAFGARCVSVFVWQVLEAQQAGGAASGVAGSARPQLALLWACMQRQATDH
jgi:hypothetical protein